MEIDLNGAPNTDMQEVIINIAVADLNGDFLELNNFIQDADEEVSHLIEQNPGFGPNNPLDNQEQQNQQQPFGDIPHLNLPIEPMIVEEVPLHMLMDEDDFDQDELEDQDEPEDQQLGNATDNVINVGAVLLRGEPSADPVLLQRFS